MKTFIFRLMLIIGLLCLTQINSFAQSASQSYSNGVALMNKGDYQEAINCFKASMAINKSAANVKKCNAQIRKCNRLAKKKTATAEKPKKAEPEKVLTLSAYNLLYEPDEEKTMVISVETLPESSDWIANVASEHESWCRLAKSMDGKELIITCLPTGSTIGRQTGITVFYGEAQRFIQLIQKGRKPTIAPTKESIKISKRKGGSQKVGISCNSDTLYADNKNWELVSKPDWCEVDATSGNEIVVKAEKLDKEHADYKKGRTGFITVRTQSVEHIIRVEQK
ncbi:MAG: hypothetical protein K6E67_02140 [Prevotella sp.]|nr:hypothetical protein [Prevotella sp.]